MTDNNKTPSNNQENTTIPNSSENTNDIPVENPRPEIPSTGQITQYSEDIPERPIIPTTGIIRKDGV